MLMHTPKSTFPQSRQTHLFRPPVNQQIDASTKIQQPKAVLAYLDNELHKIIRLRFSNSIDFRWLFYSNIVCSGFLLAVVLPLSHYTIRD
ncbi:hypothetical protein EV356DRAFT_145419 [Viridothelium virens]|uniref:Uncharacterized protein n=1 Tax=Viridothelium virens TaxID=1048519 RepID=A0A6A6H9P9_VIRVR|nr:hypothetical protein EV356DRAFT_145419 [Viridothelium virens]